ncbi:peptidoglycan-binding protein [Candidatus Saccharibacteria bacterium]|nr:peptidoglycan-binding protein [Candidatus Saccharibacteria bacterium]
MAQATPSKKITSLVRSDQWKVLSAVGVSAVVGVAGLLLMAQSYATTPGCRNAVIKYGDDSVCTKVLQHWLVQLTGPIENMPPYTTKFDASTDTRVRSFQASLGMEKDGVADADIWIAICSKMPYGADKAIADTERKVGCSGSRTVYGTTYYVR